MECNSKLLRDILAKRLETIRRFILCCSYAEVSLSLDALEYGVYLRRNFLCVVSLRLSQNQHKLNAPRQ